MKKYLLEYLNYAEAVLEQNRSESDFLQLKQEHLNQIDFMQHERLIHLIVTVLISILFFLSILTFVIFNKIYFIPVILLMMILLVPYIKHYYFLENSVQKMYTIYQQICERCGDYDRIEGEIPAKPAIKNDYNKPKSTFVNSKSRINDFNSVNALIDEITKEKSSIQKNKRLDAELNFDNARKHAQKTS